MRLITLLFLIISFSNKSFCQNKDDFKYVEDYQKLISFSDSTTVSKIKEIFGKPSKIKKHKKIIFPAKFRGEGEKQKVYQYELIYSHLGIIFYTEWYRKKEDKFKQLSIRLIKFQKPFDGATKNGVKIGNTLEDLYKKIGKENIEEGIKSSSVVDKITRVKFVLSKLNDTERVKYIILQ